MAGERSLMVVFVGDYGVGKTSLFTRIADDAFVYNTPTTIGVDYRIVRKDLDGTRIKVKMWDTAGMERFRSLVQSYFSGADLIFMVCDANDEKSWENLEDVWYRYMIQSSNFDKDTLLYILVNKWDLRENSKRLKDMDDPCRMKFIKERIGSDIPYRNIFFVSAKNGDNVDRSLEVVMRDSLKIMMDRFRVKTLTITEIDKDEKTNCCSQCST